MSDHSKIHRWFEPGCSECNRIRDERDSSSLAAAPGSHLWPCPSRCDLWARCEPINLGPVPNHHPRCAHVDTSLIDVWRVAPHDEGGGCIVRSESEAREVAEDDEGLAIHKERMHREVYENLSEFDGF